MSELIEVSFPTVLQASHEQEKEALTHSFQNAKAALQVRRTKLCPCEGEDWQEGSIESQGSTAIGLDLSMKDSGVFCEPRSFSMVTGILA